MYNFFSISAPWLKRSDFDFITGVSSTGFPFSEIFSKD